MKKIICMALIVFMSVSTLTACAKRREPIKKITILYGKDTKENLAYAARFKTENIEECNRILKAKGYPYEISLRVLSYDQPLDINRRVPEEWYYEQMNKMKKDKEPIDLIVIASAIGTNPSRREAVNRKLIQPFTDYFKSDEGKKLFNAFPLVGMNSLKVDEDYYYLPFDLYNISNNNKEAIYVLLNEDIAKAYGVDVRNWDDMLWKHKDDLDKLVKASLKGKFQLVDSLYGFIYNVNDQTPLLGIGLEVSPFCINEKTGNIMTFYEDENYQKMADIFRTYVTTGALKSNNGALPTFMNFTIKIEEAHKKVINIKQYANNISAQALAISSWTTQKKDVLHFLKLVYTDKELSEALAYGKKGKDYYRIEERAYKENSVDGISASRISGLGNPFLITLPSDDKLHKNNKALYDSVNEYPLSKAFGFSFDATPVKKEMLAITNIYTNINNSENTELLTVLDYKTQLKKLNAAGLQKVLREMNRQFQEFQKKQKERR